MTMDPASGQGKVSPRALVGKILFFNGMIFWVLSALLAVYALLAQPGAPVIRLLALIFALVGLVEVLVGQLVRLFPGGESPTARVVNHYYSALARQDYVAASEDLDLTMGAFAGQRLTQAEFIKRAQADDAEHGPITSYALAGVQANPGRRVFTIKVSRASGAYLTRLELAKQGAGWKIAGFDRF
jgi:hypothetical protein